MPDENWTPSDGYPAPLYFHCPNTNCDGHVKLRDRSNAHAIQCEKCGLEFAIGADPEMQNAEIARLNGIIEQMNVKIQQLTRLLELREDNRRQLTGLLERRDDGVSVELNTLPHRAIPMWLLVLCGVVVGLLVGVWIGKHWGA